MKLANNPNQSNILGVAQISWKQSESITFLDENDYERLQGNFMQIFSCSDLGDT